MLAIDAAFAVNACLNPAGFPRIGQTLVAPPLMWSEARATLHRMAWHGRVERSAAAEAHERLLAAPVQRHDPDGLGEEAWRLADEFGWARTYDAEYVALARLLECRLVTADARLRRGTRRYEGLVVALDEL